MIKPQPHIEPVPGTVEYRLCESWRIMIAGLGDLRIHSGYRTDGASIPRLFWRLIGHPYLPSYLAPALAHDALYQAELADRRECDRTLYVQLLRNGVGRLPAWIIWAAVRLGGGFVWAGHTDESVERARRYCKLL